MLAAGAFRGERAMSRPDIEFLASRGWDMTQVADMCSLDCSDAGYRKVVDDGSRRLEIILCPADAMVLEARAQDGDYAGALTPDDSRAGSWPWMELSAA
jgi:hypothetical protein